MSDRFWDERIETLPAELRRTVRDHRLFWQLRRCQAGSAFHRRRLEAAGLDLDAYAGLTDLARLPILRLDDLPDTEATSAPHPELAVAPAEWWTDVEAATGAPTRTLTAGDQLHRADIAARALWAAGARSGQFLELEDSPDASSIRAVVMAGARRIGMSIGPAGPAETETTGASFAVRVATDQQPANDAVAAPAPAALTWASTVEHPQSPAVGGPTALTIPYVAPTVAYPCSTGDGVHWADDHYLLEVVDPRTGQQRDPGIPGALLVTELTREGSPLIRFWTGLETVLISEPCACGRTSARSPFVRPLTDPDLTR